MKKKAFVTSWPLHLIGMFFCVIISACHGNETTSHPEGGTGNSADTAIENIRTIKGAFISPSKTINHNEFSRQYSLNNRWWNEAFGYIRTHDLEALSPGKYIIDSGNVYAIVWKGIPKEKDSVLWEAHRDFNDLQYIINGAVQMGIAPLVDVDKTVTVPYAENEDIQHFRVNSGDTYYRADSTAFFIFSPLEMHRPAIQITKDSIKKIVIKVRVPDK
ncbi:MAG: YhcH/YjgK/YiaL family protein [Ginsengibacter sp.]